MTDGRKWDLWFQSRGRATASLPSLTLASLIGPHEADNPFFHTMFFKMKLTSQTSFLMSSLQTSVFLHKLQSQYKKTEQNNQNLFCVSSYFISSAILYVIL